VLLLFALAACARSDAAVVGRADSSDAAAPDPQVLRGRWLVLTHGCGDCHGGFQNPAAPGYLAGDMSPIQEFKIGPCYADPNAKPCFITRARNLTPDNATGLGRFSERQIFNALRYGLRPGETPDVTITSTTPGKGNFPANPKYLAPPMPWPSWRHMPDADLWAIAAYLTRLQREGRALGENT
jgi:mono/diheme cytochrome c family protein